jgi:hypothetical protein
MADEGLQAVSGQEGKGSLRPEMEKTLYSRWFWMEGAASEESFSALDSHPREKHRRGRKLGRILLKGERCRIIPGEKELENGFCGFYR